VQLLRSYVNDSMLMNLKVSTVQTTPHQNISKIFQPQPVLLISPSTQSKDNECAINSVEDEDQDNSVTNSETMEVSVDPGMYLDEESITIEEDEETVSAAEAKIETAKLITLKEESDQEIVKRSTEKNIALSDSRLELNQIQNSGKHICTSCPETFSSNTELQNHIITHLITSTSSNTQISESAIEKPLRKRKEKEEKLRLRRKKIIIRINPSPSKRNVRERDRGKVLPSKFSCSICKKSLSSKRNVQLHHETHKEANGKYRCDGTGCKKLFGKLDNFLKHRQETHEKPKRRKNQNEK
jgi:C2H2-type zinc finger